MSLYRELKNCETNRLVPQSLMRRIRNALVNASGDDEEHEFLLSQLQSKEEIVEIDPIVFPHILDFLHGETR